ncbi:MAG: acetate--CoA ligase family protein [archaeon]
MATKQIAVKKPASQMDFLSAQKLAEKYGIPMIPTHAAQRENDLMEISKKIPYPWAMKVVGKTLIHKSDIGGVKLNLQNSHDAMMAFHELRTIKGCEYVAVQPQRKGIEIIVGGKLDSQFGPTVLVGMGGIYTEVFKDSSLRVCPVNETDVREMINELKIAPILHGARGQKGINENQLVKLIMGVSKLMVEKNISELDLNPVIATPASVEAVDIRIIEEK